MRKRNELGCVTIVMLAAIACYAVLRLTSGCGYAAAQEPPRAVRVDALARRMLPLLDVWTRPDGTPTWIRHCREAPHGCERRVRAFAGVIVDAADGEHLSADLLAGLALHESGLNPRNRGTHGERGIMQINPCRGDLPPDVRAYVGPCHPDVDVDAAARAEAHRATCWRRDDAACQAPIVTYAAHLLASCYARCGTEERALAAYNTGRCEIDTGYAARVELQRRRVSTGRAVPANLARGRQH